MKIHYNWEDAGKIRFPVVTMGSFDGVHAGHRVILARLRALAEESGGESVLITFHPHPRLVLYPRGEGKDLRLISTLDEKIELLGETGIDHLLVAEFTPEFSRIPSAVFVERYLVERLGARTIVVGFNHYFGHNKSGSFDSLYRMKDRFGYRVVEIPEQEIQDETVSSTRIRKALKEGHIQRANAYLQQHFRMNASFRSDPGNRDRPACEVRVEDALKLLPPPGSYAVTCRAGHYKGKGLLRRHTDGSMHLFPLCCSELPCRGTGTLMFHKHLTHGNSVSLSRDMEMLKELIY